MTSTLTDLDPDLRLGSVHLAVSDLARSIAFYTRTLGLSLITQGEEEAILGAGQHPLVQLTRLAHPTPAPDRGAGLFHFALLHPTRSSLADTLQRVASARWPISGASDHAVSEAIYLDDPDGLGIELYVDRPRAQWPRDASTGMVAMVSLPLDLDSLLGALETDPSPELASATVVGHIHLRVADVERSVGFYRDVLGMDLQARIPSAAFLAAGGYHHHIGVNSWQSRGAPPVVPTAPGLRLFELQVSNAAALDALGSRLRHSLASEARHDGEHITLRDPDHQALVISSAVGSSVSP